MTRTSQSDSVELVRGYLKALEDHDEAKVRELFADDVTEIVPFNASGAPEPQAIFDGKEAVLGTSV